MAFELFGSNPATLPPTDSSPGDPAAWPQNESAPNAGDGYEFTANDLAGILKQLRGVFAAFGGDYAGKTGAEFAGAITAGIDARLAAVEIDTDQISDNAVTSAKLSTALSSLIASKATQSDIDTSIAALVGSSPELLNEIHELASAIGDDPNFAVTVAAQIAAKQDALAAATPTEMQDGTETAFRKMSPADVKTAIDANPFPAHDHDDRYYTEAEVDALLAGMGGTPTGYIVPWPASTPPADHLECNGAAISRTTYADLFAVIGTTYGAGDGSTTFNLPDLRGEFLRMWDNGRGVDSGRTLGSWQSAYIPAHGHGVSTTTADRFSTPTFGVVTGVGSGGASTDSSIRPRNVALMAIIKY